MAKTLISLVFLLLAASCSGAESVVTATNTLEPTPTRIPSVTYAFTPITATSIQPSTPTPVSDAVYYMIVLDASDKMREPFDGSNQWDAAIKSLDAIVAGLEPNANFGLVVVGGSPLTEGQDPCDEPFTVGSTFSAKTKTLNEVDKLQAAGGGSSSTAFALAQRQLNALPENTIRALIFITGSNDGCQTRDEWRELEKQFSFNANAAADFYSEMIVLSEQSNTDLQRLASKFSRPTDNANFQILQNNSQIPEVAGLAIKNVDEYVKQVAATRSTATPFSSSYTLTPGKTTATLMPSITLTPSLTPTPSVTVTASIAPTSTITPTWTPTVTPSVTPTDSPSSVKLLSVNYLTKGVGCQIDVRVQVTGSDASGIFHVRNAGMNAAGVSYPQTTLRVGTDWVSSFNLNSLITLPGDQSQYYLHEVWFEYNGVQSNRLKDLICPGLILFN